MSAKIIIIGSGPAGISAATKLYENGFKNLIILEGENRIGGRLHTIPFASNVVDMGAQWCHGEKDNVVCELSKKFNVFYSATTKYNQFELRQSNGNIIDENLSNKLCSLAMSIVELYKEEIKSYQGSLGKFIVEKYNFIISNDKEYQDIKHDLAQQFIDFFHKYENSIEASDTWFDTSAAGYLHYWDCEGDRLLNWKDKGYGTLIDILMKKFPNPKNAIPIDDKILFNKSVCNIDWNEASDKPIEIYCSDNTIYYADHVIITVSLGVLKERHLEMFEPPLPVIKKNAIQGLSFGTVNKIFIEFKEPFWPKDWLGFSLLWTKKDFEALNSTKDAWLTDIFGFYIVDYQPNILCGWISGVNGRKMELLTKEEITNGVMFLLRKFIVNFKINNPICVKTSAWYSNPHFRGSYSFRSISTDILKTGANDLALPLTNCLGIPVLLFAGEATHEHYYSTVHGAVETGWREAKRLIDLYQRKKSHL